MKLKKRLINDVTQYFTDKKDHIVKKYRMDKNKSKNHIDDEKNIKQTVETDTCNENVSSSEEQVEEETIVSEVQKLQEEKEELIDKWKRAVADFENYKKRTRQEITDKRKYSHFSFVQRLLEAVDNLERAIHHTKESQERNIESIIEGVQMVHHQIIDIFKENNIYQIEALGKEFDPNIHEAIDTIEINDTEKETVTKVHKVGYKLYERIIRPAKVQVGKKVQT